MDIFVSNEGFVSHLQSNQGDLNLKYGYLFPFAKNLISEAKAIVQKKKYDPECSRSALQQEALNGSELIMLSESDLSENYNNTSESNVSLDIDLDDVDIVDVSNVGDLNPEERIESE